MKINIGNVVENYHERIQRLALFDPLYALNEKKLKDRSDNKVDYFSFGLLTLLFFFENMLIRNRKVGVKNVAEYLQIVNEGQFDLEDGDFLKIARTIIETFRPPNGKRNFKTFYNYETRKEDIVQYSILKADKADLETNTQYYTLDEQGLELIFATKEYFNEFQLSINQLILRKQLEKGEFIGALRQIDEMNLDVKNLYDRIFRIKHEVNRNIVSSETFERYKNIIGDINDRLTHENEEFEELRTFVKDTKEKIANEMNKDEDKKAFELIIKIDKELDEVHYEHRKLLKESILLKTSALQAAQESLYYIGINSFNFNQEIVSRIFSSPLPLNSTRRLIEPFLYLGKEKTWSPVSVFSKQRIENTDKEEKSDEFLNILSKEKLKEEIEIQSNKYKQVAEVILKALEYKKVNSITIEDVIEFIKESNEEEIINQRPFYDFWIILHQKSPITMKIEDNEEEELMGKSYDVFSAKGYKLCVEELSDVLKVTKRFTIKNMVLKLEDRDDNL